MFILPIILQEYIRNRLVNNTKENLKNNILISVLFIIVNINLKYLIKNIFPLNIGFKYLSVELFPIIVTSFIMTNLSRIAGKNSTILYRIFLKIPPIILPILPSVPWIITAIISIFLPLFIYYNILYFNMFYTKRERRFSNNKNYLDIPIIIISVFLILFILKAFKYYPIAVLSDSMEDTFQRGDSVIIEKIDDNNLKNIEKHDIIYYKKDSKYIIHRVVSIEEKEGKKIFITKGDNNQENDDWDVYEEEILGIMKISIPNIGYPAVWLYEILNN
jgi:signal peptidase